MNDAVETDFLTPVEIAVLSNDSDPENGALSVISASALYGSVAITPENRVLYTPDGVFVGEDVVDYTITDPQGATTSAQVRVTLREANPRIAPASSDWQLEQDPSLSGDTAYIQLLSLPGQDGDWQVNALKTDVDGTESYLPYGDQINDEPWRPLRFIRIAQSGTSSVRLKYVWRNVTNGDYAESDWSEVKAVTGITAEAPVINIHVDRLQGLAPFGAQFMADVRGSGKLDPVNDCQITWDYGDPGSEYLALGPEYMAVHNTRQANTTFGFLGGHTYETPGNYTVTCTVAIDGTSYQQTLTVTAHDADAHYFGTRTICVAPDGIATGEEPAGAQIVASLEAATSRNSNATPTRILIHRTMPPSQTATLFNIRHRQSQIGSYGTGTTRPIVAQTIRFQWLADNTDCVIYGIDLAGPYDPAVPDAETSQAPNGLVLDGYNTTVHDCRIHGWKTNIDLSQSRSCVISNTRIYDWWDYGFTAALEILNGAPAPAGWHTLVGSQMIQSPYTLRGNGKGETAPPFFADHGPYRCSHPNAPSAFIKCEVFTNNSWIGNSVQLWSRWNAAGYNGKQHLVSQCKTEGGSFYFGATESPTNACAVQARFEKSHHICTVDGMLGTGFGGSTFENNIIIMANVPPEQNGVDKVISIGDSFNGDYEKGRVPNSGMAYQQPIYLRHNSFIDMRIDANSGSTSNPSPRPFRERVVRDFLNVNEEGNLFHAPLLSNGVDSGPLDLISKFEPYYLGRLFDGENNNEIQTEFSNAGHGFVPDPLPGSPAFSGTVSLNTQDDFFGVLGVRSSLGALEPA